MKSFAVLATATYAAATRTHSASADYFSGMPSYPLEFMPQPDTYAASSPEPTSYEAYEAQEPTYYDDDFYDSYGKPSNVPTGDFWNQVDDFNEWNTIWDQSGYEERLATEADLMVALEALREALVDLDRDIDDLDDCISDNDEDISANDSCIERNDYDIQENDDEISDQENQVSRLQRQCRRCQEDLDEDRDALVLYCQQFAFAKDMVGACSDILTCSGTKLPYRADVFKNVNSTW